MEPSNEEIWGSRVACIYYELQGKRWNKEWWEGYHPDVYNQTYDKYSGAFNVGRAGNEIIKKLSVMNPEEIKKYTLELQMWWRDKREELEERDRLRDQKYEDEVIRRRALLKLNDEEKRVLGLK